MSLNKIDLSPQLVARLYPKSLSVEATTQALTAAGPESVPVSSGDDEPAVAAPPDWKSLGGNKKNILVVVHYPDDLHLPDTSFQFLSQLLNACKFTPNDVVIVNRHNYPGQDYKAITDHFQSARVLLFGTTTAAFGFPFEIPPYQVQQFTGLTVVHAPALHELKEDKPAKTQLWASLKKNVQYMTELIFATNNENKVREIRQALPEGFSIISLQEAGIHKEIPEPHATLEANATEKSTVIYEFTGKNCFSEDSGLETEVLNGAPGVHSARFAHDEPKYTSNTHKLLALLSGQENRKARFKTVISLIINGKEEFFEGLCSGTITREPRGTNGFGYDPVFIPDGSNKTFGQMTLEEKQEFSHRKKAVKKLVVYLTSLVDR